jgi:CDP-diacylglycerol--serine O-phosphatidyltransferase
MVLKFDNYIGAFIFIAFASVFDFLDGMAARLLKAYSNIGAELDSLADVVSFGLAPGCVLYSYLVRVMGVDSFFPFLAFLLTAFSAIRLAKFNVDTRQTTSFLGLPVPASGLFWGSFIPSILYYYQPFRPEILLIGIFVLLIIFCLLMVSEIPMFSLKLKSLKWEGNEWSFYLILIAIGLFAVFFSIGLWLLSISLIIITYIIMSLIKNITKIHK